MGVSGIDAGMVVGSVPPLNGLPGRRVGFGLALVLDPNGSTLLDLLGDDLDQRAERLERFLDRCSDEALDDLLAAFHEAVALRAERENP